MRVLSKTTIVVFGLVWLVLLGCSSQNQSEYTTGRLNLFYPGYELSWHVKILKHFKIDSTDIGTRLNNQYVLAHTLESKYHIDSDSLLVKSFNDIGNSVTIDSITPGVYCVYVFAGIYREPELDTVIRNNDTLIAERIDEFPPNSLYKPILLRYIRIKAGEISIAALGGILESEPPLDNDILRNPPRTIKIIKWEGNFIPIKQEKVAGTNKAFG